MQTSVLVNYPASVRRKVHHRQQCRSGKTVFGCRNEQLAVYKRPQHVQLHDALPKTNVGKILRRELQVGSH